MRSRSSGTTRPIARYAFPLFTLINCNCTVQEILITDHQPAWSDTLHQPEPEEVDISGPPTVPFSPKPAPIVRPKPPARPKPAARKPVKQTLLDKARDQIEKARLAQIEANRPPDQPPTHDWGKDIWQARQDLYKAHPEIINRTLSIEHRIKLYELGEVKRQAVIDHAKVVAKETAKEVEGLKKNKGALDQEATKLNKEFWRIAKEMDKANKRNDVAAMESLRPQFEAAERAVLDKRREVDAIDKQIKQRIASDNNRVLDVLRLDPAEAIRFQSTLCDANAKSKDGPLHPAFSKDQQTIDQATEWLSRFALKGEGQWKDLIDVKVGVGPGYRAHHRHYTDPTEDYHIQIAEGEDVSTVIHEYGHAIDSRVEVAGLKVTHHSIEFLEHRTQGQKLQKLKDLFPDAKYDDNEVARDDDFGKAFSGDQRLAMYAGKDYSGRSSEVLSMGLELLHKDAAAFARNDPEYFKYVIGVLDGSLR